MYHYVASCILALAVAGLMCAFSAAAEPQVAHMVYFKLKEGTDKGRQKLVAACHKYLSGHQGTVYFSAGVLAQDLDREVNVRDFDVGLHLVFINKAAHDRYQTHARHLKFIEENKSTWDTVRVFDSYVIPIEKNRAGGNSLGQGRAASEGEQIAR